MASMQQISPCLWFDNQAEDAAKFYVAIFEGSSIDAISRYGQAGFEIHGRPAGSVMTVAFRLQGREFTALNGGPDFKFSEAISLQVFCDTQKEIDYFWSKLGAGGEEGPCGWLKDKFGLSWQIIPTPLPAMLRDPDTKRSERVMQTFLKMKKFDLAALERAYAEPSSL
jgi:predicted 3-demethylubiquinone-9 3-methyltransferase (glyoxalase superfamily)